MKQLDGKKTYIVALLAGALTAFHIIGYVDSEVYLSLMGALGAGGLATLRDGVSKAERKRR